MIDGIEGSWRLEAISADGTTLTLRAAPALASASADDADGLLARPARRPDRRPRRRQPAAAVDFEMDADREPLDAPGRPVVGRAPASRSASASRIDRRGPADADDHRLRATRPARYGDPFPGCGIEQHDAALRRPAPPAIERQARRARRRARAGRARPPPMNVPVQADGPGGLPTSTLTCAAGPCFASRSRRRHRRSRPACRSRSPACRAVDDLLGERDAARAAAARRCAPTHAIVGDARSSRPSMLTVFGYDAELRRRRADGRRHDHRLQPRRTPTTRAAAPAARTRSPGRTRRSSSTATPRRTASGTAAIPRTSRATSSGPSRSTRSGASPTPRTRTTSGSSASPTRSTSPATTSSTRAACSRASPRARPAVGRLHGLRRRPATTSSTAARPATTSPAARATTRSSASAASTTSTATRASTSTSSRAPARRDRQRAARGRRSTTATRRATSRSAPVPSDNADLMDAGGDVIYGEGAGTVARRARRRVFDDVSSATTARSCSSVADPNLPDARLQKIQTTLLASLVAIESRAFQNGGDDVIFGNVGRDTIVAGAGDDMADGDEPTTCCSATTRSCCGASSSTPPACRLSTVRTSPHFQALCGTLIYSRTDRTNACGGAGRRRHERRAAGQRRAAELPRSRQRRRGRPRHARRGGRSTSSRSTPTTPTPTSSTASTSSCRSTPRQRRGEGPEQLRQRPARRRPGARRAVRPDGRRRHPGRRRHRRARSTRTSPTAPADRPRRRDALARRLHRRRRHDLVCDYVGDAVRRPGVAGRPRSDGEDYIEGNGGRDVVFGGLGQDDVVGGSSSFFGLNAANDAPAARPPAARTCGPTAATCCSAARATATAATTTPTSAPPTSTTPATPTRSPATTPTSCGSSARTAADLLPTGQEVRDVRLRQPTAAAKLVVRGVTLLDYTPGGPDFRPDLFFAPGTESPACSDAGSGAAGTCSTPLDRCAGTASKYTRHRRPRRGPRRVRRRHRLHRLRQRHDLRRRPRRRPDRRLGQRLDLRRHRPGRHPRRRRADPHEPQRLDRRHRGRRGVHRQRRRDVLQRAAVRRRGARPDRPRHAHEPGQRAQRADLHARPRAGGADQRRRRAEEAGRHHAVQPRPRDAPSGASTSTRRCSTPTTPTT